MSKELATKTANEMAVPSYIKQGTGRGSENITSNDIILPRIGQAQDISPELKKSKAEHIEGAVAGDLFNTLTRENYGNTVSILQVQFKVEWLIWKDRKMGGGFAGSFSSELEAKQAQQLLDNPEQYEVTQSNNHLVLVVNADGSVSEASLSCSKSKLKASRQLNSLIRLSGGDSFGKVYALSTTEESSDLGDFYGLAVSSAGYPTEEQYKHAEAAYESLSGANVSVAHE
ncbi:MAG: hypothetical protein R8M45_06600 [Ghiorsea sp.]